jgi:glycosyltransferase involved in cell wall biosynthesis
MQPSLVSCIMPTADRRAFIPRALDCFLAQDYPHRELIILDDGNDSTADLIPVDPRIRYIRSDTSRVLGAKRNECIELSRGDLIMHWDDDDWHAPTRISTQVRALLAQRADVCGLRRMLFIELPGGQVWLYDYPRHERLWLIGGSLLYTRAFWERSPFPIVRSGEDTRFLFNQSLRSAAVLDDLNLYVATIHSGNTSPKDLRSIYWSHWSGDVQSILGFSAPLPPTTTKAPSPSVERAPESTKIGQHAIVAARQTDLQLPEFIAYNAGRSLPRMRTWEQPFALWQARLTNTAAVLDCTINPAGLATALAEWYPHALYRWWNPTANGCFQPPIGVPDSAFDRVLCINTLEHLLGPQRDELMRAMVRKLKPGGLLVLTCDYYFDGSWQHRPFLELGVMRADRTEQFNGWNRVRASDVLELCARHGLTPLHSGPAEEPDEADPTLFRSGHSYPHACIGGVFSKPLAPDLSASRGIVLALLTWNTRDVSIDSAFAHLREARTLRRLGHQASICICDNGSTDGTGDALRAFEKQADVVCTLILNTTNRGNSIARNQIIDCARAQDADYVLLVDGDIELVPFSSVAMLRHLENAGSRLGCIGADSRGQTADRHRTSSVLSRVDPGLVDSTNLVTWTQYGLFRRDMFDDGVRFDESGPFDGAGWGFEDNDLAFQIETRGYLTQYFRGMLYLHRNIRSSIRIMRERGIDPGALYARRKQFIVDKWSNVPAIANGPLRDLRRIDLRV